MASDRRVEANRRNAARSTGPRSAKGKARSAQNAVTHGILGRPGATGPEAMEAYRALLQSWVDELRPVGVVESVLVERACRNAWRLSRCARYEDAAFARRARSSNDRDGLAEKGRVESLARQLLATPGPDEEKDEPAVLVAGLEMTSRGVDWLLGRWASLGAALDGVGFWDTPRKVEAVRLLGLRPEEVLSDPAVASVFLSAHMADPRRTILWFDCFQVAKLDPASPSDRLRVKELEARLPASSEEGLRGLRKIASDAVGRLRTRRVEVLAAREAADREESGDLALFDEGPSTALLLRYEASSGRALHRALGDLLKLREANAFPPNDEEELTSLKS